MRDGPPAALFAQTEREPQAVLGLRRVLLWRSAAEQRVGERDVVARRDVE